LKPLLSEEFEAALTASVSGVLAVVPGGRARFIMSRSVGGCGVDVVVTSADGSSGRTAISELGGATSVAGSELSGVESITAAAAVAAVASNASVASMASSAAAGADAASGGGGDGGVDVVGAGVVIDAAAVDGGLCLTKVAVPQDQSYP
jgi:hypothetical protein